MNSERERQPTSACRGPESACLSSTARRWRSCRPAAEAQTFGCLLLARGETSEDCMHRSRAAGHLSNNGGQTQTVSLRVRSTRTSPQCAGAGMVTGPSTDESCSVRTKVGSLLRNQATRTRSKEQANADLALSIYKDLDAMCRGGAGDRPETQQACDVRNKSSALLRKMGYC